jgi:hypothetical protein
MISQENMPIFKSSIYTQIALNDLVTFATYYLTQINERISAENITAACYLLFPERFSLHGYPQWPDSTVVNKRWIDCRNRGYIAGSTAEDFSLTAKGLDIAEKVAKTLGGSRPLFHRGKTKNVRSELRTRAGRFVNAIEASDAYLLFKSRGRNAPISEYDFRNMLLCTMESTAQTLNKNLDQFKQFAADYKRNDLFEFLEFCQNRFQSILNKKSKGNIVRGGMLPKKII